MDTLGHQDFFRQRIAVCALVLILEGRNEFTTHCSTLWFTTHVYTQMADLNLSPSHLYMSKHTPYFCKYTLDLLYCLYQCNCINHLRKSCLAICQIYFNFIFFFYISVRHVSSHVRSPSYYFHAYTAVRLGNSVCASFMLCQTEE